MIELRCEGGWLHRQQKPCTYAQRYGKSYLREVLNTAKRLVERGLHCPACRKAPLKIYQID